MKDQPSDGGPKKVILRELTERLLKFVIATCYPKMIRRLGNKTLSQPYITSLEQVKLKAVSFDNSQGMEASEEEIENDRLFLVRFLLPAIKKDWIASPTPKILHQAKLAENGDPFHLYTDDTCMEFHQLLIDLLRQFETSLANLSKSRKGTEVPTKVPTEGSADFKKNLTLVFLKGYGLQKIAKGAALRMHLKNISFLLNGHRGHHFNRQTSVLKARIEGENEELEAESDEELEAVQPSVIAAEGLPIPLWKSYRDWLKLMVVHFDAVEILAKYVTGTQSNFSAISIKILVSPPVDKTMLPWKELFADPTLFPTKNAQDPCCTKTNDQIIDFFSNVTKSNPTESLKYATAAKDWWGEHDVESTIEQITSLKNSTLPGFRDFADKLHEKLRGWTTQSPETLTNDITNSIQSLCDNAFIFHSFIQKGGEKFTGTLHCEACLASLLNNSLAFTGNSDGIRKYDILAQLKVGYAVSNCFWYQTLILVIRIMDELLEFQNFAAQCVDISLPS